MISQTEIRIRTKGRETYDLTRRVQNLVQEAGIAVGLCQLFIRHTSASLMICENADPAVLRDLEAFMSRLVPDGDTLYTHTAEGPDDMPAHVRSILTQTTLSLPVRAGRCDLGTWQGIYLWEHRHRAHDRSLIVTITGE